MSDIPAAVEADVFDFEPQVCRPIFGPEPSIRRMVRSYYARYLSPEQVDAATQDYFSALQHLWRPAVEAGSYSPKPVIFTDHPRVEYVTRDCPTVSDRVDGWLSLIRDMATNEIIGASIDLPKDALPHLCRPAEDVAAERSAAMEDDVMDQQIPRVPVNPLHPGAIRVLAGELRGRSHSPNTYPQWLLAGDLRAAAQLDRCADALERRTAAETTITALTAQRDDAQQRLEIAEAAREDAVGRIAEMEAERTTLKHDKLVIMDALREAEGERNAMAKEADELRAERDQLKRERDALALVVADYGRHVAEKDPRDGNS